MINLLSPEKKRDIRAARTNVVLLHYTITVIILSLIVGIVYGGGFWLVANDKATIESKIASEETQTQAYTMSQAQATEFRKNLRVAKQILGSETSYSNFLTTLGGDLPIGSILTGISLGNLTPAEQKDGFSISARTASYEKALETKTRLESSSLFEDVNIINVKRPEDISKLSGLESRYPFEASFNVHLSRAAGERQ